MDSSCPIYSPVCMIYSGLTLDEIIEVFKRYGAESSDFGPLRIVRKRNERDVLEQTNQTIALISKKLFERLIEGNLHLPCRSHDREPIDFRIVPYEIRSKGENKDLFVRIPPKLEVSNDTLTRIVEEKMSSLLYFGVIKQNQYKIKIPLRNKNRSTGMITGSFFITFDDEVTYDQAAAIKAVIDDTPWNEEYIFRCFWSKERGNKKSFYRHENIKKKNKNH